MRQTSFAKQFWNNIPGPIQVKLLNNFWCSSCRNVTGVVVETMTVENGDLVIKGKCTKCNNSIARLIEGDGQLKRPTSRTSKIVDVTDATLSISKIASFKDGSKAAIQIDNVKTLKIKSFGKWNPKKELFDDLDENEEQLSHPYDEILNAKERPIWEMENILPGLKSGDFHCPIGVGIDMLDSGDWNGAIKYMKNLLLEDARCLDAYAHLGSWYFEADDLNKAKNFYKTGVAVGLKSISNKINDVFPWGLIDNRPFLRCLHGLGITLYRQRNVVDAMAIFQKMIWLNPRDNQGARFLIDSLIKGVKWEDCV